MSAPLLQLTGIHKRFGPVAALSGVDFEVRPGEVHGLVGENGSGKSTLMKIAYGELQPSAGEIRVDGETVTLRTPQDAARHGVVAVAQEVPLVDSLSVGENIVLGRWPRAGTVVSRRRMREQAAQVLDQLQSTLDPETPVSALAPNDRQVVAIARALATQARVIVLDEPTSSLTEDRAQALFDIVRRLRDQGLGLIFISQRLPDLSQVADRITALRDGQVVGTLPVAEATEDRITRLIVGRSLDDYFHRSRRRSPGEPVLEVSGLAAGGRAEIVSFTVRAGEVLGLAGLVGSGRTEVLRAVFGADRPTEGRIQVNGRQLRAGSPRAAIRSGVAFVTGDRKGEGLVLSRSVAQNITLARGRLSLRPISGRGEAATVTKLIERMRIRPPDPDRLAGELSGGNQQKVVFAKWIALGPRLLLLDEPTRGIDVGAKSEIYGLIDELAAAGVAVVLSSSENSELIGVCDRVLVLFDGRVVAERECDGLEEVEVAHYAAGGHEQ
ncbi:sugar ABC transporter ATP-binding protein [Micromonospora sp. NPDC003816]|uniref:sugar ABC transporter ATP-binding protein n=1 Tax=Micromonospora sp. NPDC003816 TaxID=3364224 RepID=UPI0036AE6893